MSQGFQSITKKNADHLAMVHLRNVTKVYPLGGGKRTVLDRVDLTVAPGEKVGILGRNGSGKSTLVRLIGGSELPTSGHIRRLMKVSWPLAFSGGFQSHLSGLDNLRFICRIYDTTFEDKIPYVQEFSELGRYLREDVRFYSSGMRARLAFALSMVIDFDCYLIDEVVAVGDDRFKERCQTELFEKRGDRAMVIVSHSTSYIRQHCTRASVLLRGSLHHFQDVEEGLRFYKAHSAEQ
jgi:capsular polysaccharide transport system ATP-binding protein